jgi:hypothetical protein
MDMVSREEFEAAINKNFKKTIRIVGENSSGQFSNMWTFVGGNDGFYLGSRNIFNAFKVSLHANNNRGYVAYTKSYFNTKRAEGWLANEKKAVYEWDLPVTGEVGATHAVVVRLPAQFMRQHEHPYVSQKKALVFGIEDGCALEVGIFLSRESHATIEGRLIKIGTPLCEVAIDNWLKVHIVVRSASFDSACLPNQSQITGAIATPLDAAAHLHSTNLSAMLWNDPGDGGTLQIVDVGGVSHKMAESAKT